VQVLLKVAPPASVEGRGWDEEDLHTLAAQLPRRRRRRCRW
jgi:hypothetical protein